MRLAVPLALALLVLPAPLALAQEAPSLELSNPPPALLKPGSEGTANVSVRYCYRAAPAVPATVEARTESGASWLRATAEPSSFRADTSAGQSCGNRNVVLHLRVSRDAPAYTAASAKLTLTARGAGGTDSGETHLVVQGEYWAELEVSQPEVVRIRRGDLGTVPLMLAVGANDGTRLEITGFAPRGFLTVQGTILDSGAGRGLDQKDSRTVNLNVAVDPDAARGRHQVVLNVSTHYVRLPSIQGESVRVVTEVEVFDGNPAPGPAVALAALAPAVAAMLLARRRRGRRGGGA